MHHYLYAAPDEKSFVRFPGIWEWIYAGRLLLLLSTGLNEHHNRKIEVGAFALANLAEPIKSQLTT